MRVELERAAPPVWQAQRRSSEANPVGRAWILHTAYRIETAGRCCTIYIFWGATIGIGAIRTLVLTRTATALLFESAAKYMESGPIFFTSNIFLQRDQGFEIEHANRNALGDDLLRRMLQQSTVVEIVSDGSEHVKGTELRNQIQMPLACKMTQGRANAALGLHTKHRIERFKNVQETFNIHPLAGMDDVDVKGMNRRAVQNGGQTADQNEVDPFSVKGA